MKTQRISILDGMSVKVRIDATVFSWLQIRFGANHSNLILFLKRNEATAYFIDFCRLFCSTSSQQKRRCSGRLLSLGSATI